MLAARLWVLAIGRGFAGQAARSKCTDCCRVPAYSTWLLLGVSSVGLAESLIGQTAAPFGLDDWRCLTSLNLSLPGAVVMPDASRTSRRYAARSATETCTIT